MTLSLDWIKAWMSWIKRCPAKDTWCSYAFQNYLGTYLGDRWIETANLAKIHRQYIVLKNQQSPHDPINSHHNYWDPNESHGTQSTSHNSPIYSEPPLQQARTTTTLPCSQCTGRYWPPMAISSQYSLVCSSS
jgi:hypothetical protein